jgi:hypothetical protein
VTARPKSDVASNSATHNGSAGAYRAGHSRGQLLMLAASLVAVLRPSEWVNFVKLRPIELIDQWPTHVSW